MVYVYAADISELPDPKEFPESMDGIREERKKKIERYRQTIDRKQSLGAGLMLKKIFEIHGIEEKEIFFGEHGKPQMSEVFFNLSHSGNYVVCVIGKKNLGCDIEKIGEMKENLAKRFFTKKENEYLATFEDIKKRDEFYRIWTLKESYLKMTGEGMSFSTNRVEFVMEDHVETYRDGIPCACFIKEYELPGYKLSVCAEEQNFAEKLNILKL